MKVSYRRDDTVGVGRRSFEWPVPAPEARKLVCLPYAGGTSTVFRPLAEALGPMWSVVAIDPPGHGLGAPEPPLDSVPDLCDVLDAQLDPNDYADGYLLGYSVGGYVAHGLMARWEAQGRPCPRGLILCAANPYTRRHRHPEYSKLDDNTVIDLLDRLGGLPEALREEREIFDLFKHVVFAGFRAYETAPPPDRAVTAPALAIGGRDDVFAHPDDLDEWHRYCRRLRIERVDGPHILLPDQRAALAQCLVGFASELEDNI